MLDNTAFSTEFERVLGEHQLSHHDRCLLIIDAAQYDERDVLRQIYTCDSNPQWHWLFDETLFEQHKDAGPIVVETTLGSRLCQHAASRWAHDGALLILVTDREQSSTLAGIRKSLMMDMETYGPCFVRVYDGRFLELLNACFPSAVDKLICQGDRLIWAVDHGGDVHWSSATATTQEVEGLRAYQGKQLERLLTWVSGWPRCMALINTSTQTLSDKVRLIVDLWAAGLVCPECDVELATLWQFAEQDEPKRCHQSHQSMSQQYPWLY